MHRRDHIIRSILKTFLHDEKGQTFGEYILAVVFIGLGGIVLLQLFPDAIRAYVKRIYTIVSLPFP